MRSKLFKAFTTMAVAGLLLTGCGDKETPKKDEAPQATVDLTGFPELKLVEDDPTFHEWFAYNGADGKARRVSLSVQEYPNGGYTEKLAKNEFMRILAKENGGKPVSEKTFQKEMVALEKRQNEEFVYFGTHFAVEKLDDGIEEEEPRSSDGEKRMFFETDTACEDPGTYEVPFEGGCLISKKPGTVEDAIAREGYPKVKENPHPFNYGDDRVLTELVAVASGGISFEAKGAQQGPIRNAKKVFVAYDLEEGGEPIEALPNFTCEPGTAGQAILDAYKSESDAEGGIAKRYLAFSPKDSGCTLSPVTAGDSGN
ncbi:hypothetical protein [Glutamicibacter ardleyensis]|uniref:hypothetical protein n=1 Tax=Glutamicibacter ardleyensis TaxID=225894 RepID=UPI003FD2D605